MNRIKWSKTFLVPETTMDSTYPACPYSTHPYSTTTCPDQNPKNSTNQIAKNPSSKSNKIQDPSNKNPKGYDTTP